VTSGMHNRISIALQPKYNRVGAFYDILHEFAFRNVNILKVLSQPMHNANNDVILYLELEGNLEDEHILESIQVARMKSTFLTMLGSFLAKE
jgi:prephenate dehydratase